MLATRLACALALLGPLSAAAPPLRLHPANPHYFLFRGKPLVLITSGEHYGAVINQDFDYIRYLETLRRDGLNLTRLFTGVYREVPGSFKISRNTLSPARGKFLCPWKRSSTPGAADGNRFDLAQWDEAYFTRLKDFVQQASRRGIVVEINLFCPYYDDQTWAASPLYPRNNMNGTPDVPRTEVLTLKHDALVQTQTAMVRKIVEELKNFDNIYYEICNEPYFGGVTLEWQKRIAETITATETDPQTRHLISQNIANGSVKVEEPFPEVSIFNFHYSRPPASIELNYPAHRVIGMNETGFDGTRDATYRVQGWDFLLAGGALYNSLDYSFAVGFENGTAPLSANEPGGGGPALRQHLRVLRDFLSSFDLPHMVPSPDVVRAREQEGYTVRALAQPGQAYAIYVHHGTVVKDAKPPFVIAPGEQRTPLTLDLPAGDYEAVWIDPKSGHVAKRERFHHQAGDRLLAPPPYQEDIALRVKRR